MRNKGRNAATILRLLENARYEILPTPSTEGKVLEHLPLELLGGVLLGWHGICPPLPG